MDKYFKYDSEELKNNLPDYIKNNIEDKVLYETIKNELETNDELKNELEKLKDTFGFLDNSGFEKPPENYFTNLSVKINEKIHPQRIEKSFWGKLDLIWKILIPAVPIAILLILLLTNFFKNDSTKIEIAKENPEEISVPVTSSDKTRSEKDIKSSEEKLNNKNDNNKVSEGTDGKKFKRENTKENILSNRSNNFNDKKENQFPDTPESGPEKKIDDNYNSSLNDLFAGSIETEDDVINDETEINSEDDENDLLYPDIYNDDDLDEDFQKLSEEDQKEILENLTKSKI